MNRILLKLTIPMLACTLAISLPLSSQAGVYRQRASNNVIRQMPPEQHHENRSERLNFNGEPRQNILREENKQELERKYDFDRAAEKKIEDRNRISKETVERGESINNKTEFLPINSQQERKEYVQDFNWKSSPKNVKTIISTANNGNISKVATIPSQKEAFAKNNKTNTVDKIRPQIGIQRDDINKRLRDMQNSLHDKNKFYNRHDRYDSYRDALIQRVWRDIRRSLHDVQASKMHPYEIEKYRRILERDLHDLIRDKEALAQYDRNYVVRERPHIKR